MSYATSVPPQDFLWRVFQSVDLDRSGYITEDELQKALSNGTWNPFSMATVRLMISMFDSRRNNTVSFEEFGSLWKYVTDWQKCFQSFDRDNSGSIDRHEFATALQTFGYRLNDATIDVLLQRFDRSRTRVIFFDDFIACCVTLNMLTSSFRERDTDLDGVITIRYEEFLTMVLCTMVNF